jgi:hemoglobin
MTPTATRLALSRDIRASTALDEAVLERLVRAFYQRARQDEAIGPMFAGVQDWEHHIARISSFWASAVLQTGTYRGQPLPPHFRLGVQPEHFARWLVLFEETARDTCSLAAVAVLMDKARTIARGMQIGLAVARGELPVRA